MQDVLIALILGGTIAFSMYAMSAAYRGKRTRQPAGDLQREVTGLREQLDAVRREVAELGERLDFAERMLAKERNVERIAPPKS